MVAALGFSSKDVYSKLEIIVFWWIYRKNNLQLIGYPFFFREAVTPTTQEFFGMTSSYPNRHGPTKTSGNASFDLSRTQTCHWATCREPDGRIEMDDNRQTMANLANEAIFKFGMFLFGLRGTEYCFESMPGYTILGKSWHGVNTWLGEMVAWFYSSMFMLAHVMATNYHHVHYFEALQQYALHNGHWFS